MKDLCKAMGICWHEPVPMNTNRIKVHYRCSVCMKHVPKNWHIDPTDEAFLWRALTYMMGREDWVRFYAHQNVVYSRSETDRYIGDEGFIKWLLLDPARFIALADEWCREHKKGE